MKTYQIHNPVNPPQPCRAVFDSHAGHVERHGLLVGKSAEYSFVQFEPFGPRPEPVTRLPHGKVVVEEAAVAEGGGR